MFVPALTWHRLLGLGLGVQEGSVRDLLDKLTEKMKSARDANRRKR